MGKLLSGHYGEPPDAESISIPLKECYQRLGLKPTDFVSSEEPGFFKKAHGAHGKYLVFWADADEIKNTPIWREGYYLLPLGAADVLKAFGKNELVRGGAGQRRPIEVECKETVPVDVRERIMRWADQSQPLLFQCYCPELLVKADAPSVLRRGWKLRLTCKKRCQPPIKTTI